jgi:hypothetical protein
MRRSRASAPVTSRRWRRSSGRCWRPGEGGARSVGLVGARRQLAGGHASPEVTRSYASIREEVERLLAEAARADAAEDERLGDARGDELPAGLVDPRSRRERLRRCSGSWSTSRGGGWLELKRTQQAATTKKQTQAYGRASSGAEAVVQWVWVCSPVASVNRPFTVMRFALRVLIVCA